MTTLRDLKPINKELVWDITDYLGIPRAPIFDWCFMKRGGPYLLNVWHDDLQEENGEIFFIDRATEWSEKHARTAATVQRNRASAVASLISTAYYSKSPVHVAILGGVRRIVGVRETSEAHQRELDEVLWYPHHKDENGRIHVIRGRPQPADFDPYAAEQKNAIETAPFPSPSSKVERGTIATYERDSRVVRDVKARAKDGCCELCGVQGFLTPDGSYYLEAHHVIPLNFDGPDDVRNVVAICSDHHRQLHFGAHRDILRDDLIWQVLHKIYPEEDAFFEELDRMSLEITRNRPLQKKLEDQRMDT